MLKLRLFFILLPFITLSAQQNIPVNNSGFENGNGSWILVKNSSIDSDVSFSGKSSLHIGHSTMEQSSVLSEQVKLKTGELYKLSAMVKTSEAYTNLSDRYPTPVAACISMESFPFTNHSAAVGSSKDWTKIEVLFLATTSQDRIKLNFGYNGKAKGEVWFDEIQLQKVDDITEFIPFETVRWFGKGFRYDDKGWIFVHIEGEPYDRGYQYGNLVSEEMIDFMTKLAVSENKDNPENAWNELRFIADALMLRKYDEEYLTEMKGIADGCNKAGGKLFKRKVDLLDVVTMNSAIDIDYYRDAAPTTSNPLSGQSFLKAEDELNINSRLHKCSSFLANKTSTSDGRILFGQLFMWGGYTGALWNVMCDVVPAKGNRLVYETFPGGIHSGADFYINSKGIMIGETTVSQTPFNPDGTPQSNRIRKAAQYANSIDDVVEILTTDNNGMYTNDWLIGDTKTDEIAVLLLGTYKYKLWRSKENDFYGDTKDFYWCNNNSKDPEVKKEYISNPDNAPYDLIFNPWNRDIAFNKYYEQYKGSMNVDNSVRMLASSPINRPHACDGKITTSEMAEKLIFLANFGKVTLREKFVGENGRIPDLPNAAPHLSLGYSVFSPIFVSEKLIAEKQKREQIAALKENPEIKVVNTEIAAKYLFNERKLWFNTVYPSGESENWFVSGTSAYWQILRGMPLSGDDALKYSRDQFAELNCRYLYTVEREGAFAPADARRDYTKYNSYQLPRIKGTYLLHQLRLYLGNDVFSDLMNKVHEVYREKNMSTNDFIKTANQVSGKDLTGFIQQWLNRNDLPEVKLSANIIPGGKLEVKVSQTNEPYHFMAAIKINSASEQIFKLLEISGKEETFTFDLPSGFASAVFNPLNDIPQESNSYYTWANIFDDWKSAKIVYGTTRQIEANHTLALRFSTAIADRFTEDLIPVIKDYEVSEEDIKSNDLILLGGIEDNSLISKLIGELKIEAGKNFFRWNDNTYSRSDEGIVLCLPNPFNSEKVIYLFLSNSSLELYQMTKIVNRIPQWAVFRGDKIVDKGYFNR